MLKQVQHDNGEVLIMKLIIVGGHLSPALAVIEALQKDVNVLFIGRKYVFEGSKTLSLEFRTITKRKIPFVSISTGRWQRKFTRFTIPSLLKFPFGILQSFLILKKFKPDVVLSFGGYLSLPVGIAAFILRIPIVIHEQTLEAGIANKVLSIFAKTVCISWETSRKYFPKSKVILTGNPMRKFEIRNSKFEIRNDNELPILYITGGSSGSHFINTLVEGCITQLLEKYVVIHQTGDAEVYRDFDRLQKLCEGLPSELKSRYTITKFVEPENVGSVIKMADLVVSRGGINTITELILLKKPSLLIPLPSSQKSDQNKNALYLKSLGLAEIFYQDSLNPRKFIEILIEMIDNIDRYKILNQVQNDRKIKNAAQKIIEATIVCKEHK